MKKLSWLFSVVLLALSCQENQNDDLFKDASEKTRETIILHRSNGGLNARLTETGINCGETQVLPLMANSLVVGSVEITVDQTNITLHYDLTGLEWFLYDFRVFAGHCDSIPAFSDYPYFESFPQSPEVREFTLVIPLADLPECGCIDEIVTVARYNPTTSQLELLTTTLNKEYCSCDEPDDENLRTQTPGGWGAPPEGNNPGAYLHANFDDAFPAGLVVGCTHTITFTTAQAITDGLPQGGEPSALTKSYVDPNNKPKDPNNPKNTLASHVVALKLSVTFDAWDEDFGESSTQLANAVVTSGDFMGWTVAQVLAEAEKVLGGCASSHTASQMTTVLTAINESFVDGTTNTGFLQNQ
jgi:hypothetical protein